MSGAPAAPAAPARARVAASAAGVPSPCINVCRMNEASGLCEGCWRTLDEIGIWSVLEDDEKRAVWQLIDERRSRAPGATAATTAATHTAATPKGST